MVRRGREGGEVYILHMAVIRYISNSITYSLVVVDDTFHQVVHKQGNRGVIAYKMPILLHLRLFRRIHPRLQVPLLSFGVIFVSLIKVTHRYPIVHDLACMS